MAQAAEIAQEGVAGRVWNALVGNPAIVPDAQRMFVPDPPRDVLVQGMQAIDALRDFNERVHEYDLPTAVAFLKTRFYGQPMTARYRAQCSTVLCQELDRQNVRDIHRRAALVEQAVEQHINDRLTFEPRWNATTIEEVNEFNNGVAGRATKRSPYWYWKKDNISINSDLNSKTPWQEQDCFKISHLIYPTLAVGGAIIGLATVGYCVQKLIPRLISQLWSTTETSIIIQNPNLQQVLPLLTDTAHSSQTLMTQQLLQGFTSISENLSAINKNIVDNNTSIVLMTKVVDDFTKQQQMSWIQAALSRMWSPPSPS